MVSQATRLRHRSIQQAPFARGAIISARNLHKSYGNNPVLRNVNLDIYPGESVAIMGPSGSGKTTLLHALSGIISSMPVLCCSMARPVRWRWSPQRA